MATNFWGIALGVATIAFALGFGVGAFVIRRSIQKYGINKTRYEKNLAEYKSGLGPYISDADRAEIKSRPLTRRKRFAILAGDGANRDD